MVDMSEIHPPRTNSMPRSRREMLTRSASGFGALAFAAMHAGHAAGAAARSQTSSDDVVQRRGLHHPPRARRVIFLYMDGGPSQVDTFDPKPMLDRHHGKDPHTLFDVAPTQFANLGKVLRSPWQFKRHGECGLPVSSLFPRIARHADDLAVVRSMVSNFPEHTFANYFLHTGSGIAGRPSMGAWVNYGLGTDNENLPGFVAINGGLVPPGGLDCFGSGFLPADYQASLFRPDGDGVANITSAETSSLESTHRQRTLLRQLDQLGRQNYATTSAIDAAINNYELAFQMQTAVPELMSLDREPEYLRRQYGMDSKFKPTQIYAAQCLLARRLVERGVRFVELTCPRVGGDRWDQHNNLKTGHENNARAVDQPIAALLADLKARGMLDETLVVWAGEFGRTPFAQGANGRDHNPMGFSIWMAGGGIRGGITHGETDPWGYRAIRDRVTVHDLHATMLHLMGVDHTRSTYPFGGREMRLTDVHGNVVKDLLA